MHYLVARPGLLRCPACQGKLTFPVSARLITMFAGLLVGTIALVALYRSGLWATATASGVVLQILVLLACVAVMLVVKALTGRAVVRRLEK